MILPMKEPDNNGVINVVKLQDYTSESNMEFDLLRLGSGQRNRFTSNTDKERAFMLMSGKARIDWQDHSTVIERNDLFQEKPSALHVPPDIIVTIEALSDKVEFAILSVQNLKHIDPMFYPAESVAEKELGTDKLGEVARRTIRTVVDDSIAPDSNMCFGEILNAAGRWSSYPPHYHPQPEIYHYRFHPENGFGYSEHGDDVYKVMNEDTALIYPNVTHPQVAAPGYTMYYFWAIPHLERNRFTSVSRIYENQHKWILG